MSTMFCITDQDIEKDLRVLSSLMGDEASLIVNISASSSDKREWTGLPSLVRMLALAFFYACHPIGARCFDSSSLWSGLGRCLTLMTQACAAGKTLRALYRKTTPAVLYAHDLYPAVAVLAAGIPTGTRFIYDSHEVQWGRNRKNGFFRSLLEFGLEYMVLRRTEQFFVVNTRILELMRQVYGSLPPVSVRPNDFFKHHALPCPLPSCANRPVIVYVGKGTRGRGLELLDSSPEQLGFDVYAFLCGANLPPHIQGVDWHIGPVDYEDALICLARSRRCLMWCCAEPCCLSYKLATPNKFYQALAAGIPVIARKGTYLAEVVEAHSIGWIFDGTGLAALAPLVCSNIYETWAMNIEVLRGRIKMREIIL